MTLAALTTPRRLNEHARFVADVPDGWQQGRGAFGGLVLATLTRAAEAFAGTPDRALRTLTAELCGPVEPGAAEITIEPLRVGGHASTLCARMAQRGEVRAHAVLVLGHARSRDLDGEAPERPTMPPWRDVPALPPGEFWPPFARHFEFRPTVMPFAGAATSRASGWLRSRDPGPPRDPAYLVALADAWWPALFSRLAAPSPMATITFTLAIVDGCDGLDADAPLFHDARVLATRDGYSTELRTLWGEDGRLLAINQQTLVTFRS